MKPLALAFLFLVGVARAGGGGGLSSLGAPAAFTKNWHCRSGHTIPTFSPNTQSIRLLYRGKVQVLMFVPGLPTENRVGPVYSQIARPGDGTLNLPTVGTGLELVRLPASMKRLYPNELYRVSQDSAGKRSYTLLERCWVAGEGH